ncbi:MAG TPA: signal peptidase II [Candidatus Eisenbacteria bacterium]|nr:signal peptidase II [Candidatus Eisenbacteria bacterium]
MPLRIIRQAPAWLLWLLAAGVFVLDRLAKHWVLGALATAHTKDVLGDFLRFTYVRNPGVAFGLFAGHGLSLGWLSLIALAAVVWLALRTKSAGWPRTVALGLILGGAAGNLYDRLRWGSVVDFIDVGLGPHRFWTFNVADSAITVGVIVWAAALLLGPHEQEHEHEHEHENAESVADPESAAAPEATDHARGA